MQRLLLAGAAVLVLAGAAAFTVHVAPEPRPVAVSPTVTSPAEPSLPEAQRLQFREFFEPGAGLQLTPKLRALSGKRVRLVGFMAQLELAPRGAFYLVPRPVRGDESGAGTADLPPESVLVISASSAGQIVPFLAGVLEVAGILEVGNQPDSEGRVSAFRLRLDAGGASPQSAGAAPEGGSG